MKHLCLILPFVLPAAALAEAPNLQTPSPVLYLADNLDESDQLGYCLDTVGRGQSDRAHVHSCKPRGGDVQFRYNAETQQIQSATFANICLDIAGGTFALIGCASSESQKFAFAEDTGHISPAADPNLCLSTAAESGQAGPYMSRDLTLADCATTPVALKTWVQKN